MKPRAWYHIQNEADNPAVVDIQIVDFIGDWIDNYYGFGVTAKAFIDQLAKLPAAVQTIRVHINSPGGDVFSAVNIANALRDQQTTKNRTVETIVDGIAASAASIIMMAGNVVRIADNGMVMIHNPWSIAIGEAKDMRKAADTLDAIRNTIVATYQWHSELTPAELTAMMDAETWMDADDAIVFGFATEKVEGLKAAASLDPSALAKMTIPEKFKAKVAAMLKKETAVASASEILTAVDAAGLDAAFAKSLVDAGLSLEAVTARIATATTERTQARSRATEITALCKTAKLPELADGYIKGGMTAADVRAQLTVLAAKLDGLEIDGGLTPDTARAGKKSPIDTRAIYASRNGLSSQKESRS